MKIMVKGFSGIPPRFWFWVVCDETEIEEYKKSGYSLSECRLYLTQDQLNLLK